MISQVAKWGNSLALRIPRALAQTLAVTEGKAVELRVEGGCLFVTPIDERPVYRLEDLLVGMDPDVAQAEVDYGEPVGDESF